MRHKQSMREATCATELASLLSLSLAGDAESFAASAHSKAKELATTAFGEVLVHTIGRVYTSKATLHLHKGKAR